jgi:hypothetical protein
MDKCIKIASLYITTLKAISLISQHQHWLAQGDAFYSSHLLFERIYNSALKDLDLAAEKFVGLFGDKVLNYDLQVELLAKVLGQFSTLEGSNGATMCLAIEKQFLKFSQEAEKAFLDDPRTGRHASEHCQFPRRSRLSLEANSQKRLKA